ncbi:MAG: ATP synthase F1 subunit gamma [Syntrophobacterales bacterium]|jgi:F-type H+-transporting ATPase subunit gamma|nr:ATP synthase F1 subunit gamma [Syntrophobacterales bacterium]
MASLRDIKRKISSIDSTQTITRTVKMVSASKLRKAQTELDKTKAYAMKMEDLVRRVVKKLPSESHPLLTPREEINKVLIVSIASDRGLAGAFNTNICLAAENFIHQNSSKYERMAVYIVGKKAKDYLSRRKVDIIKDWADVKKVDQDLVDQIADELIGLYMDGSFDKIYLSYTHFQSAVKQIIMFDEFVPLSMSEEELAEGQEEDSGDYLYEPTIDKIVDVLIPKYISTKIYYALVESQASEHAARMAAMENATSNCGEMVRYLTLVYNKRRQESITNEMMDIVGGAEALRGT